MDVDLRAKHAELEEQKRICVEQLDAAIAGLRSLEVLDRHLVVMGFQPELQLPVVEEPGRFDSLEDPLHNGPPPIEKADEAPPSSVDTPLIKAKKPEGARVVGRPKRSFTNEQRAEFVREADELGNDSEVQRRHDLSPGAISQWRKAGHGKRPKSTGAGSPSPSKPAVGDAPQPPATGPTQKCPSCSQLLPLESPDPVHRLEAWKKHYKISPACEATNRRRSR